MVYFVIMPRPIEVPMANHQAVKSSACGCGQINGEIVPLMFARNRQGTVSDANAHTVKRQVFGQFAQLQARVHGRNFLLQRRCQEKGTVHFELLRLAKHRDVPGQVAKPAPAPH